MVSNLNDVQIKDVVIGERMRSKEADTKDLQESLQKHGLISPILLRKKNDQLHLVAGWRRLTAATALGWDTITAVLLQDHLNAQVAELIENVHRSDFTWQEKMDAVLICIRDFRKAEPKITLENIASRLAISHNEVNNYSRIGEALERGEIMRSSVDRSETASRVIRDMTRRRVRESNRVEMQIINQAAEAATDPSIAEVHNASFFDWVDNYTGAPFNVLHCDFPYGVNVNACLLYTSPSPRDS